MSKRLFTSPSPPAPHAPQPSHRHLTSACPRFLANMLVTTLFCAFFLVFSLFAVPAIPSTPFIFSTPISAFAADDVSAQAPSQETDTRSNVERMQEIVDSYESSEDMAWLDSYLMAYAKLQDAFGSDYNIEESDDMGILGELIEDYGNTNENMNANASSSTLADEAASTSTSEDAAATPSSSATGMLDYVEDMTEDNDDAASGFMSITPYTSNISDTASSQSDSPDATTMLLVFMIILLGALVVVMGLVVLSMRRSRHNDDDETDYTSSFKTEDYHAAIAKERYCASVPNIHVQSPADGDGWSDEDFDDTRAHAENALSTNAPHSDVAASSDHMPEPDSFTPSATAFESPKSEPAISGPDPKPDDTLVSETVVMAGDNIPPTPITVVKHPLKEQFPSSPQDNVM